MKVLAGKKWPLIMLFLAVVLIAMQFIGPAMTNPKITEDVLAPDSVKMVLRSSCYNCHSNEINLLWFDKIAPVSWMVSRDIRQGREAVNFSEWDRLPKERQKGVLFEALNQMQFGTMPLPAYTFVHPGSKTGPPEINIFKSHLGTLMVTAIADSIKSDIWNKQYAEWIRGSINDQQVKPSLNGLIFQTGYKNWVVISSTVRADNGTLKIIMGNGIAVKAIKNHQTNPWPDGSSLAKLTWIQTVDAGGNICTGEFKQIAFMVKDAKKYRATEGWGFSQWDQGLQMTTHGKTALFTTACVNCHKPMKAFDYVFTQPIQPGTIAALEDKLICSSANSTEHQMSTLYGNDIAAAFARSPYGGGYPPGARLTLVTWKQKEDDHWFGGYIPDTIQLLEKLSFNETSNWKGLPDYERYAGNQQTRITNLTPLEIKKRIAFITSQRGSVMP